MKRISPLLESNTAKWTAERLPVKERDSPTLVGVSAPVYRRREGRELMGMRLGWRESEIQFTLERERERESMWQKGRSRKHIHLYTYRGEGERKGRFKRGSQRDGVTSWSARWSRAVEQTSSRPVVGMAVAGQVVVGMARYGGVKEWGQGINSGRGIERGAEGTRA